MKVSSKLCLVKNTGLNGNLFGGEMLAWMDEISAIYAWKTIHNKINSNDIKLVTLRFGEIKFLKPVKVGDIVDFFCFDHTFGTSSITFKVEGKINDELVFSTDCTFVRVDSNGNKLKI